MTSPALRHATRDDLDALLALYAQLNPGDVVAPRERLLAILDRIVASDALAIVVATLDDAVVATCYLNVLPNLTRGGASYAVIENVVVDAARRGAGLGQAVMRFALDEAWRRGCYKALLQTGVRDPAVHRLLRVVRFQRHGEDGLRRAAAGRRGAAGALNRRLQRTFRAARTPTNGSTSTNAGWASARRNATVPTPRSRHPRRRDRCRRRAHPTTPGVRP